MITARYVAELLGTCVGCIPYGEPVPGGYGGITKEDLLHALGKAAAHVSHCGPDLVRVRYLHERADLRGRLLSHLLKTRGPGGGTLRPVAVALAEWDQPDLCPTCNGGQSNAIRAGMVCPACRGSSYRPRPELDEATQYLLGCLRAWEWEVLSLMAKALDTESAEA